METTNVQDIIAIVEELRDYTNAWFESFTCSTPEDYADIPRVENIFKRADNAIEYLKTLIGEEL